MGKSKKLYKELHIIKVVESSFNGELGKYYRSLKYTSERYEAALKYVSKNGGIK